MTRLMEGHVDILSDILGSIHYPGVSDGAKSLIS